MDTRSKLLVPILIVAVFFGGYLVGSIRSGSRSLSPQANKVNPDSPQTEPDPAAYHQVQPPLPSPRFLTDRPETSRTALLAEREASGFSRAINKVAEDGYELAFIYAGLSEAQLTNVLAALSDSIKLSMIEEQATIDATSARKAYEQLLMATLSPEQLKQYRDFEKAKPLHREESSINDFLSRTGKEFDHDKLSAVLDEVGASKAFAWQTAHDPFDVPFKPQVGAEDSADYLRKEYERYAAASQDALGRLQPSLSEDELAIIRSYFSEQLGSVENEIQATTMTREQILEEARRVRAAARNNNATGN